MFLIDSNIWLEFALKQAKAMEVERFLEFMPFEQLFLTNFALHSIGVVLVRNKTPDLFARFVNDLLEDQIVGIISLAPGELDQVLEACKQYRLDFDDAYQYVAAEKHDLIIVSFDADFDRTPRGRKTPAAAMAL